MNASRAEVLQGTLDRLVLKTLETVGPMHGFGIALRLQQVSEDVLQLNEGHAVSRAAAARAARLDHTTALRVCSVLPNTAGRSGIRYI